MEAMSSSSSSEGSASLGLPELPRDCLVRIVSFLGAIDACCVARVCLALRSVADSDDVWDPRLPPDAAEYHFPIISKKDLFFRLRFKMLRKHPLEPYWLDPWTGEGCIVKGATDLTIVWGDDERYWHWVQQHDSWFLQSAKLHRVCWFEVRGEIESMFSPGAYTVSFRIMLLDRLDRASGWVGAPVKLSLSTSDGQCKESHRLFSEGLASVPCSGTVARLRSNGTWMELDVGEFLVGREMRLKVNFSMMEIVGGRWKRGVTVDGVKIQPSRVIAV